MSHSVVAGSHLQKPDQLTAIPLFREEPNLRYFSATPSSSKSFTSTFLPSGFRRVLARENGLNFRRTNAPCCVFTPESFPIANCASVYVYNSQSLQLLSYESVGHLSGFRIFGGKNGSNYRKRVSSCLAFGDSSCYVDKDHSYVWNASEIAKSLDGKIIKWGPPGTICTDSRSLLPGQWFFAILGEKFDGHNFLNQSLDKGCAGVIGNRVCDGWQKGFIQVEGDTLIALKKMAIWARNRCHGTVVGLTGSVGKTTTRTMIALALENLGHIHQTRGNQNNHIGVALSLIGIPDYAEVSVLEFGMSRKGEILNLSRMSRPSVRMILNVGYAHMENFSSLEEISWAKGELLLDAEPGDVCILNADDPLVMGIQIPNGVKKVLFGRSSRCDVQLVLAENVDGGCAVRVVLECKKTSEKVEFKILSPGLHLAFNACGAAAVAISLGISLAQVGESLSKFRPVPMRSSLEIAKNGIRIINDVYNANFTSTVAAINLLKSMDCKAKRVAILGDMLELGALERYSHEEVLKLCCKAGFDLVALVGKRFIAAARNLDLSRKLNIMCANDSKSVGAEIIDRLSIDDVVLVKGSRGMQMENVVDAIKEIPWITNKEGFRLIYIMGNTPRRVTRDGQNLENLMIL